MHGVAGSPRERPGGGAQLGPRHGGQVRVPRRVHAQRPQHNAVFLRQLDGYDPVVQRGILSLPWFRGKRKGAIGGRYGPL